MISVLQVPYLLCNALDKIVNAHLLTPKIVQGITLLEIFLFYRLQQTEEVKTDAEEITSSAQNSYAK